MDPQGTRTLASGFLRSAESHASRPALEVGGAVWTYAELHDRAASIAATLAKHDSGADPPLTAVFALRSEVAYSGILGALLRGHGYVPLNRTFPSERTRSMLERSECRSIVVDRESAGQLQDVVRGLPKMTILLPEEEDTSAWSESLGEHLVLGRKDLQPPDYSLLGGASPDSIAYLLFTSGSTGTPKGVMVAHRNVLPFLDSMTERYGIGEADRLSQMFDLTFDLSVFDMFMAWGNGACLCVPSQKEAIHPGRFIRRSGLTVWFSVPSTAVFMKRFGALKEGSYPSLRWSLFCGEPLPVEVVKAWAGAADHSTIENLYGPTEVTIACMLYRWDPPRSPSECVQGVVPIGFPYPGMDALIADESGAEVDPGDEGELLMSGPQVTPGYWRDREKTEQVFIRPPGRDRIYYRTGDRVRRPERGGPIVYLGRMDHQIKIHGHRVELGEIEAVLREESGVDAAIALGWPRTESGASGIAAFLGDKSVDADRIRERVAARLPEYMVPRKIILRSALPLNANGKFDRKALMQELEMAGD